MIGVFDSGHGGLTVLQDLLAAFPDQRFVYLGDHGNAPYGTRGAEEVLELTRAGVECLFQEGCRLVLLACNTAAAVALRRLQQEWLPERAPDRRVLGVLVPMVEAITRVSWLVTVPTAESAREPRTVGIFATPRTVESGAYPHEIAKRAPAVRVVQEACPELAGAIETGLPDQDLSRIVRRHVEALLRQLDGAPLDSVVLGCTHYPLVASLFAACLPAGVEMLSQPDLVAASLARYLRRHPEFAQANGAEPRCRLLTTGAPDRVGSVASRFFGQQVTFEAVAAAAVAP